MFADFDASNDSPARAFGPHDGTGAGAGGGGNGDSGAHGDQDTAGPLTRRLQQGPSGSGPLHAGTAGTSDHTSQPAYRAPVQPDFRIASFSLLDGTVLARFQCHVDAGQLIIGRGSTAAIRVNDAYVHREHAVVTWDPTLQAHLLVHLGGRNGTWLNLERVNGTPVRLTSGARVRVGKTELIYQRLQ